jgi:hypothetical protein
MSKSLADVGTVFEGHSEVTEKRRTNPQKKTLLWLIGVGGTAILASYAYYLFAHPELRTDFWGGVPGSMRSLYVASMFMAVAGFFAFTRFVFRLRPAKVRVAGRFDYRIFQLIYALILVPSALWMPLTYAMIQDPGAGLWFAIRLTLTLVGIGSLSMVTALLWLESSFPKVAHRLAVVGSIAFSFQTAVLDALVWPAYFPV